MIQHPGLTGAGVMPRGGGGVIPGGRLIHNLGYLFKNWQPFVSDHTVLY